MSIAEESTMQRNRLALILKTGRLRLWFFHPATRQYIYCEDTGDGISKEMQHKIFERFFKVNDFIQGTGLGLSICKAIVEACHGTIGVQSEGIGHGTTFWVWISEEMKDEK